MRLTRRGTRRRRVVSTSRAALAALVLAAGVLAAGCGGSDEESAPATEAAAATEAADTASAETGAPPETGAAGETTAGAVENPANNITDYVEYTGGTDGPADPNLSPIKIGWVNNEGGSIAPVGPTSTGAAEWAVEYVNDHLGGIDGHPLELVQCPVKNAEEEGLQCAQQFLNDPDIAVIAYGAVAVGANTINSTVAGQKPIIMSFSLNPSDVSNPNTYILFAAGNFSVYGWGTFGRDILGAKTNAVLYPEGPGLQEVAAGVKEGSEAVGIETTLVGFDPNASDLTGALTAAGAQNADMVSPIVAASDQCVAIARGLESLGVDPAKVVGFLDCSKPALRDAYGGDFPQWYYGIAQSGDAFIQPPTPAGTAFREALIEYFGNDDNALDAWYSSTFSLILTIAKYMNAVGADNVTPEAISEQAANFAGPLLMGGAVLACGKYPDSPAVCGDGDQFFRYKGDGVYERIGGWIQTPIELQEQLGATTTG